MPNDLTEIFNSLNLKFDVGCFEDLNALSDKVEKLAQSGFIHKNYEDFSSAHRVLQLIYQRLMNLPPVHECLELKSTISYLYVIKEKLERQFVDLERKRVNYDAYETSPLEANNFVDWLYLYIRQHQASKHPFYSEYIRSKASYSDLKYYYIQESTIDSATDDFLALMQIGVKGRPKLGIAKNYWDEMGCGNSDDIHSTIFTDVGKGIGLDNNLMTKNISLEALICGNLQNLLCFERMYFYHGIGYFAAVEYLSPIRFEHVLEAWKRNDLNQDAIRYYELHYHIDQHHSEEWKADVLVPLIEKDDSVRRAIFEGVEMRLNTSIDYLDSLSNYYEST